MTRQRNTVVSYLGLAVLLLQVSVVAAQSAKLAPPAPVPTPILAAKKVFVANAGGDELFDDPKFGGADRTYNQFYAAMTTWGRYELVGAPADADLLFEIQLTLSPIERPVLRGDSVGAATVDPQFRLVIRDAKTNAVLWGFSEHLQWAILQGNRDRNFDQAMGKIVGDVQALASPTTAPGVGGKQ